MAHATRATTMLEGAGVPFAILSYTYDPDAERIGLHAAEALGEPPPRVLKTLMALADGKPVCAIVPSDAQVSMKRLAAAFGARAAAMMPAHDAERLTGYVVGGISPFGQKKRVPTAIEAAALCQPYVIVNAGQRGLQLRIAPADAVRVLQARTAALVA